MTWLELVHEYYPGVSDDEANALLWGGTCYPFGKEGQVREQLLAHVAAGCKTPDDAIARAHEESHKEWLAKKSAQRAPVEEQPVPDGAEAAGQGKQ